jgi:hypothetical protein
LKIIAEHMGEYNIQENLKKAVLEVIVFFDMFDFPLTAFEIWKFLSIQCNLSDVQAVLFGNELSRIVEQKNGFYFLFGRAETVVTRMRRYNYANAKIEKVRRIARVYKFIPWVKMIAAVNMFGANNLKQESDIDLFIITAPNRIWLTRFCCAGFAAIFHLRPTPERQRDKICLSFYISESQLNLQNLLLADDIHFAYWLASFTPIYSVGGIYEGFMAANNWLDQRLPNWQVSVEQRQVKANDYIFYRDFLDVTLAKLEPVVRKWQLAHLPDKIREMMNADTRVVVNDKVLKFHVNDRREEYNNVFNKKTADLI